MSTLVKATEQNQDPRLNCSVWRILWISLQWYQNNWWRAWIRGLVVPWQLPSKRAARDRQVVLPKQRHTQSGSAPSSRFAWMLLKKECRVEKWNRWCGEYSILEEKGTLYCLSSSGFGVPGDIWRRGFGLSLKEPCRCEPGVLSSTKYRQPCKQKVVGNHNDALAVINSCPE